MTEKEITQLKEQIDNLAVFCANVEQDLQRLIKLTDQLINEVIKNVGDHRIDRGGQERPGGDSGLSGGSLDLVVKPHPKVLEG